MLVLYFMHFLMIISCLPSCTSYCALADRIISLSQSSGQKSMPYTEVPEGVALSTWRLRSANAEAFQRDGLRRESGVPHHIGSEPLNFSYPPRGPHLSVRQLFLLDFHKISGLITLYFPKYKNIHLIFHS